MSGPIVDFALSKAAYEEWGMDIAPATFAFSVSGGITVDGVKTQRAAIVTQHYHHYHAPGDAKAADHLSTSWNVEFMEDGDPQEQAILHNREDAMAVALAYCSTAS